MPNFWVTTHETRQGSRVVSVKPDDTEEIALNRCGVCGDRGVMGLCGDCARLTSHAPGDFVSVARPWTRADLDAWLQDKGLWPGEHITYGRFGDYITFHAAGAAGPVTGILVDGWRWV